MWNIASLLKKSQGSQQTTNQTFQLFIQQYFLSIYCTPGAAPHFAFNKHLLSTHCVTGPFMCAENLAVIKTDPQETPQNPSALMKLTFYCVGYTQ